MGLFLLESRFCKLGLVLICAFSTRFSMASVGATTHFYQAQQAVKSQTNTERKLAAQAGLLHVLERMTGQHTFDDNARIQKSKRAAWSYVDQFQYGELDDEALQLEGYNAMLSLTYSATAVKKLLREAGIKYWPERRPSTLVWLVEDSLDQGKQLRTSDAGEEGLVSSLDRAAAYYGLPFIYPLLDLQDQFALTAEQLWQLDDTAIAAASQRYGADGILIGRYLTTSTGEIRASWQYSHLGETQEFETQSTEPALMGMSVIAPVVDFLAQKYAVLLTSKDLQPQIWLLATDVNSFGDYRQLIDYLESLTTVSQVSVERVEGEQLLLEVTSSGQVSQFMDVLALSDRLQHLVSRVDPNIPVWQQLPEGGAGNPLRYRWSR